MKALVSLALVLAAVTGCQADQDLFASGDQRPVEVIGLLIANSPEQVMDVHWVATPANADTISGPNAADVQLWLVDAAGDSVLYRPTATPFEYTAQMVPVPAMTYRLTGTVRHATLRDMI